MQRMLKESIKSTGAGRNSCIEEYKKGCKNLSSCPRKHCVVLTKPVPLLCYQERPVHNARPSPTRELNTEIADSWEPSPFMYVSELNDSYRLTDMFAQSASPAWPPRPHRQLLQALRKRPHRRSNTIPSSMILPEISLSRAKMVFVSGHMTTT